MKLADYKLIFVAVALIGVLLIASPAMRELFVYLPERNFLNFIY
jgi:hypothetical protein